MITTFRMPRVELEGRLAGGFPCRTGKQVHSPLKDWEGVKMTVVVELEGDC